MMFAQVVAVVADCRAALSGDRAVLGVEVAEGGAPIDVLRFALAFDDARAVDGGGAAAAVLGASSLARSAATADAATAAAATAWRRAVRAVVRPRWPVGELLIGDAVEDYQAAFSRLFAARRALSDLEASWPALARAGRALRHKKARSVDRSLAALAPLTLLHQRAATLCRAVVAWMQRDGVEPLWRHLAERLEATTDYDAVRLAHRAFLLDIRDQLCLDEEDVGDCLDAVFVDVARLATLLESYAWRVEDTPSSVVAAVQRDFDAHAAELVGLDALRGTAVAHCGVGITT